MKLKNKNKSLIICLVAAALLLGLGIQLILGWYSERESRREAGEAAELFAAAFDRGRSAEGDALHAESMALNSENKRLRAEKLSELELLVLVNPWTPMPEGYVPELQYVDGENMTDVRCAEELMQMMEDCRAAGNFPYICSSYRSWEKQTALFENKVLRVILEGYSPEEAPLIASQAVAVPGTSEHQLGLSVDIIDMNFPVLNHYQEQMPTQQWLMEHCWEYGFILRFPTESSDITGIIYEPWHYRYVGREFAKEITELNITLEEYLQLRRGR